MEIEMIFMANYTDSHISSFHTSDPNKVLDKYHGAKENFLVLCGSLSPLSKSE